MCWDKFEQVGRRQSSTFPSKILQWFLQEAEEQSAAPAHPKTLTVRWDRHPEIGSSVKRIVTTSPHRFTVYTTVYSMQAGLGKSTACSHDLFSENAWLQSSQVPSRKVVFSSYQKGAFAHKDVTL